MEDNPGEGDCQFAALTHQLSVNNVVDMDSSALRQRVIDYLRNNPKTVGTKITTDETIALLMHCLKTFGNIWE